MMRLALAAQGLSSAEIEDLTAARRPRGCPADAGVRRALSVCGAPAAQKHAANTAIEDMIGGGASNNWVVSGARTRSGKPLLANDPHLRLSAPSIWYLAHLALERPGAGPINVVGADAGRRAPDRARPRRHGGVGLHQHRPRRAGHVHREDQSRRPQRYLDARRLARRSRPSRWRSPSRDSGVRTVERRRTRHGPVLPGFYRNLEGLLGAGPCGGPAVDGTERRRHHHRRRHVRSRHTERRTTTWSACASTWCRCRAWWWPTPTATSA